MPPASSGQFLGALKRDGGGKIVVLPRGRDGPPAVQQQPGDRPSNRRAKRRGSLPIIAARGFVHKAEAARFRREIRAAINQARRNLRPGGPTNGAGLTLQQVRIIQWLKARDREVRRHEGAHYRAGRPYTRRPVYDFITGPDGRRYAIAGQVSFRLPSDAANASGAQILRRLRAAALAPARPSARDRDVAQALSVAIWKAMNPRRGRAALR